MAAGEQRLATSPPPSPLQSFVDSDDLLKSQVLNPAPSHHLEQKPGRPHEFASALSTLRALKDFSAQLSEQLAICDGLQQRALKATHALSKPPNQIIDDLKLPIGFKTPALRNKIIRDVCDHNIALAKGESAMAFISLALEIQSLAARIESDFPWMTKLDIPRRAHELTEQMMAAPISESLRRQIHIWTTDAIAAVSEEASAINCFIALKSLPLTNKHDAAHFLVGELVKRSGLSDSVTHLHASHWPRISRDPTPAVSDLPAASLVEYFLKTGRNGITEDLRSLFTGSEKSELVQTALQFGIAVRQKLLDGQKELTDKFNFCEHSAATARIYCGAGSEGETRFTRFIELASLCHRNGLQLSLPASNAEGLALLDSPDLLRAAKTLIVSLKNFFSDVEVFFPEIFEVLPAELLTKPDGWLLQSKNLLAIRKDKSKFSAVIEERLEPTVSRTIARLVSTGKLPKHLDGHKAVALLTGMTLMGANTGQFTAVDFGKLARLLNIRALSRPDLSALDKAGLIHAQRDSAALVTRPESPLSAIIRGAITHIVPSIEPTEQNASGDQNSSGTTSSGSERSEFEIKVPDHLVLEDRAIYPLLVRALLVWEYVAAVYGSKFDTGRIAEMNSPSHPVQIMYGEKLKAIRSASNRPRSTDTSHNERVCNAIITQLARPITQQIIDLVFEQGQRIGSDSASQKQRDANLRTWQKADVKQSHRMSQILRTFKSALDSGLLVEKK